jgi:hypothetical protein
MRSRTMCMWSSDQPVCAGTRNAWPQVVSVVVLRIRWMMLVLEKGSASRICRRSALRAYREKVLAKLTYQCLKHIQLLFSVSLLNKHACVNVSFMHKTLCLMSPSRVGRQDLYLIPPRPTFPRGHQILYIEWESVSLLNARHAKTLIYPPPY